VRFFGLEVISARTTGGSKRIGLALDDACQHFRAVQVHPGLTSWGILSRPYGTGLDGMFTQD
jgi:hypothetical protein